jgi:hypothetical protein
MRARELGQELSLSEAGLPKLMDKDTVLSLLRKHFGTSGTITVAPDSLVNVTGDCHLDNDYKVKHLPIKFDVVGRTFKCTANDLTSLNGAPKHVEKDFNCSQNELTSLVGGPLYVGGKYECTDNPLVSLEGFPKDVLDTFYCTWSPDLPLLRTLQSKGDVLFFETNNLIHPTSYIINRYKRHIVNIRHTILDCQRALIEAGYTGNARW